MDVSWKKVEDFKKNNKQNFTHKVNVTNKRGGKYDK